MRNWLFIKFGGLIFGPKIFFGFVGNPTSLVKVHGKKKKFRLSVHSMGYLQHVRVRNRFFSTA